jgi:ubiquinone/menaquinone biosynthesis C-methylase UbiE
MSLRNKLFALTYDRQMAGTEKAGLRAMRERLLAGAHGDVLEIGGGTGLNLTCYGPAVGSLTITEPQPPMLRRLETRARAAGVREHRPVATVLRAPAEDLPFDDQAFDVAVSTLVLCGVDDQPRALRELRRVLRPGGELLFIEHVRAGDPATARRQDRGAHRAAEGPEVHPARHRGPGQGGQRRFRPPGLARPGLAARCRR